MRLTLTTLFSFAFIFLFGATDPALAANVCFSCHEKSQFKDTITHKPVAESQCSVCHNPHVAKHKGLLRDREDTLCYSCHQTSKEAFAKGVVHPPVARGECSACHTPHASSEKGLISKDLAKDCLGCHTDLQKEYKQTHKPYGDGNCTTCHRSHQADNLQLLSDKPDALCLSCHGEDTLQASHKDYPLALKDCLSCHNPHGSDRKGLIRNFLHQPYVEGCSSCHQGSARVDMATCLTCHEETGKELLTSHSHITLQEGNSCLNCHSPHAGDDKALLKYREKLVCNSCHGETLSHYSQTVSQHPPIKKCSTCHKPHGSRNLAMLKADGNVVCIQCHETQGNFTHPVGPEVLDSHTGQMVTCVSCHNPMGTNHKDHLVHEGKRALCILCHRAY
jgi:predicted CXXCH cytochrome family protein